MPPSLISFKHICTPSRGTIKIQPKDGALCERGPRRFGEPTVAQRNALGYGHFLTAKMLGQLQALGLVIRTDAAAIEGIGPRQHVFVDQAADDLTVLDNERH